jgi:hypothetical protein
VSNDKDTIFDRLRPVATLCAIAFFLSVVGTVLERRVVIAGSNPLPFAGALLHRHVIDPPEPSKPRADDPPSLVYERIANTEDCSVLQVEFDRVVILSRKYAEAADKRMRELGCYEDGLELLGSLNLRRVKERW